MCVDDPSGNPNPGTPLQFFHCHGYASNGGPQRWHLFCTGGLGCAFGGRDYQIATADSEQCIGPQNDVFGSPGERLVLKSCFQTSGWTLIPQNVNGTDPLFLLEATGSNNLCMAAGNLSDSNSTPLVLRPCDGFQDAAEILEFG